MLINRLWNPLGRAGWCAEGRGGIMESAFKEEGNGFWKMDRPAAGSAHPQRRLSQQETARSRFQPRVTAGAGGAAEDIASRASGFLQVHLEPQPAAAGDRQQHRLPESPQRSAWLPLPRYLT